MQAQELAHPVLVILPVERAQGTRSVGDQQRNPDRRRQPIEAEAYRWFGPSLGHCSTIASKHVIALATPAVLASTRKLTLGELNLIWIANILVALVAALHAYFLILEMFLWDKPQGLKVFRNTPEKAAITKVLAANQGLYNGFLAAGLVWGLVHGNPAFAFQIKAFFLLCVIVAGAYGAATVSTRILMVQALPAALALLALFLT